MRVTQQMMHSDWGMIRQIQDRFMPEAVPNAGKKSGKNLLGKL
jgi:hypothetical protein